MNRCYSDLKQRAGFLERYEYLRLGGIVGADTFGFDRYLNQRFYRSDAWKRVRRDVIIRDEGRDLGVEGYELQNGIIVHHMNPITIKDIIDVEDWILNPEYLICVSAATHNAIHYGDPSGLPKQPIIRRPGDTKLW